MTPEEMRATYNRVSRIDYPPTIVFRLVGRLGRIYSRASAAARRQARRNQLRRRRVRQKCGAR